MHMLVRQSQEPNGTDENPATATMGQVPAGAAFF
jgi:hypothetical protein